jgi:hypothetical protein
MSSGRAVAATVTPGDHVTDVLTEPTERYSHG